jgi:hypothetical protein
MNAIAAAAARPAQNTVMQEILQEARWDLDRGRTPDWDTLALVDEEDALRHVRETAGDLSEVLEEAISEIADRPADLGILRQILASVLAQGGDMSASQAVELAEILQRGMTAAVRKQIAHRLKDHA